MASSKLLPNEFVIHDTTPIDQWLPPEGQSRGLNLHLRHEDGYAGVADPFPSELLIPEGEWQARIQEKEQLKNRLSDISVREGHPCKDQNGTNYCWANGPTYAMETVRLEAGEPLVILSPASVAAPIKGYRNIGGWGKEALVYIVANGICPVEVWPANSMDRKYNNADSQSVRKKYRVTEWVELRPRNLAQLISCVLQNKPVAVGYSWWSHEVTGVDAVWLDGKVALRIRNSWGMGWGDKGFSVLQGSKMLPDDAVVPRVATAA